MNNDDAVQPPLEGAVTANNNQVELANKLAELRRQKHEVDKAEKVVAQALKDALITAGAEELLDPDGEQLVHIVEFPRESVDGKKLAALHPEIHAQVIRTTTIRQLRLPK